MSANIFTGGLIGAAPTNFYGLWGVDLPGVTYRQFYDPGEYKTEALSDSPLGLWMLDDLSGTVCDDSAGSYDLTYVNSPRLNCLGASFNIPTSVEWAGTDQRATTTDSATYNAAASSAWSMEAWIAWTSTSLTLSFLTVRNSNGNANEITGILIANFATAGTLTAFTWNAANTASITVTSGGGYNDGKWHHVVATAASGGSMILYVDGVNVGSSAAGRNATATNRSVTIGANRTTGNTFLQFFPGYLAGCAYYSTALSATVVTDHYNAGKP